MNNKDYLRNYIGRLFDLVENEMKKEGEQINHVHVNANNHTGSNNSSSANNLGRAVELDQCPLELLPLVPAELNKMNIDELLDIYSDYQALYETFGDKQYKGRSKVILIFIKDKVAYEKRKGGANSV